MAVWQVTIHQQQFNLNASISSNQNKKPTQQYGHQKFANGCGGIYTGINKNKT